MTPAPRPGDPKKRPNSFWVFVAVVALALAVVVFAANAAVLVRISRYWNPPMERTDYEAPRR